MPTRTTGSKDGRIHNPETCHVDLKSLQCKGVDAPTCLTATQVHTAQVIMSPALDSHGKVLFPRLEPGTELRWARLAGGPVPGDLFLDEFRYVVYQNPSWDWRTFSLDRGDAARANAIDKDVDDLDPHLAPFAKHGGKLILYQGWADQQVAPVATIDFYQSAVSLSAIPLLPPVGFASSWFPAWDTAPAAKAPTPSIKLTSSSNGWSRASLRRESSRRIPPRATSIAPAPSALTLRSPAIAAAAASTMQPISPAKRPNNPSRFRSPHRLTLAGSSCLRGYMKSVER